MAGSSLPLRERGLVSERLAIVQRASRSFCRSFAGSSFPGNDYALVEGLDGVRMGRIHDNVWRLRSGLTFYTGRRR